MDIILTDLEGTLTTGSSWRGFRRFYRQHYSPLTYNLFFARFLPRFPLMKLGLLDRQKTMTAWMKAEINLMRGFRPSEVNAMAKTGVSDEMWPKARPDVLAELEKKRLAGAQIVIVSGAYQPIVEAFARKMNASAIGTPLVYKNGRLAGMELPVNSHQHKVARVRALYPEERIIAAYGDTLSDVPMLKISEQAVAVYPDEKLRRVAEAQGWRVMPAS